MWENEKVFMFLVDQEFWGIYGKEKQLDILILEVKEFILILAIGEVLKTI